MFHPKINELLISYQIPVEIKFREANPPHNITLSPAILLVVDCLSHADTGVLTNIYLVEHFFGTSARKCQST